MEQIEFRHNQLNLLFPNLQTSDLEHPEINARYSLIIFIMDRRIFLRPFPTSAKELCNIPIYYGLFQFNQALAFENIYMSF